jgi:MoxR-like ATPase
VALQEQRKAVKVAEPILDYLMRLVEATREHEMLYIGVSPRGALAMKRAAQALALLNGRDYVVPDDVKWLAGPVFAHRLVGRAYLQDGQSRSADQVIEEIVAATPAPQ